MTIRGYKEYNTPPVLVAGKLYRAGVWCVATDRENKPFRLEEGTPILFLGGLTFTRWDQEKQATVTVETSPYKFLCEEKVVFIQKRSYVREYSP